MNSRRDFLQALLAAGALTGFGREAFAASGPTHPPLRPIPLGLLLDPDTPAGRGARLGFEEAQHLGRLLHVRFLGAPTSRFALIGLDAPKVETEALFLAVAPAGPDPQPVRPHVYFVASSPAFRRQALDRHRDRHDLTVVDWQDGLEKFGAESLKLRFLRRFHRPMDEPAWHGWMAVKIATELALRDPGAPATDKVEELRIDGHKGMPLRFDPKDHHLVQPVYLVDPQGKVVDEVAPEWAE
jgi:hypothetical protein